MLHEDKTSFKLECITGCDDVRKVMMIEGNEDDATGHLNSLYEAGIQIYGILWISWIVSAWSPIPSKSLRSIISISLFNWTAILLFPIYPIALIFLYSTRFLLNTFIKWQSHGKVSIMPGSDAVWGTESFANACNFTSLYVIKGSCDPSKIQRIMLDRVVNRQVNGEQIYSKLKWRAGTRLAHLVWEQMDSTFDIQDHIQLLNVWNGDDRMTYTEDQVFDEISKMFDYPLPRNKPQWEVYIVPKYIYKNSCKKDESYYALIFRIHHSLMDGVSAGFALQNAIADTPPKLTVNPLAPLKLPPIQRLIAYLGILIFGVRDAVRSFTLIESNCFHGPKLTGPKKLGWSKPVSLQALKAMKNGTKTSTTAVLMSALATSLQNLASLKKLDFPKQIHSSMTVAILPYPDTKPQNRFTVLLFPLDLSSTSTIERIQTTFRSCQNLAKSSEALVNFYLMRLLGQTSIAFLKQFIRLLHATILLSNVPGPAEKVKLFDGDLLEDVAFWTPLRNSIGISMSLFSYAGKVRVGMVGDSAVFPDPMDVPNLINEFEKEIIQTGLITQTEEDACFINN